MRENLDRKLWKASTTFCGVDEVGLGALAGPVVAAAVILRPCTRIRGADDSKKLTPLRREAIDALVRKRCLSWSVGAAGHHFIDRHNVLNAAHYAMRLAVRRLAIRPDLVLVDGRSIPGLDIACTGVVGGDARSLSIACASIIAKVYRDRLMVHMAERYCGYGFDHHKGYGTAEHLDAMSRLGTSPIHRRSFEPVRQCTPAVSA